MEKNKTVKLARWIPPYTATIFAAAIIAASIASRSLDPFAESLWKYYPWPRAALALTRDAGFAMRIGNYYFGGGTYDLDIAGRAYRKAAAIDSNVPWGHYQLARVFFMRRAYEDALRELELARLANPEDRRWLYIRGLIYAFRGLPGDLDRAAEDFRRFTDWMPGEWAGHSDLAWVLAKAGKYRESKASAQKAFREAAGAEANPWLWNALGVAELNLGNSVAAKTAFRRASELASGLSLEDWRRAYPGNDPATAQAGIAAFQNAVAENLRRAERAGVDNGGR